MSTNPYSVTGILFVSHNLPDIGEVQWYAHGNRQERPLVGETPHDLLNHWPVLVLLADFAERKYIPSKYLAYLFHDGTHGGFSNTKQFSSSIVAIGVGKPTQIDCKATNCNGFKKVRQCSPSQYGVIAQLTDIQTNPRDILKFSTQSSSLQPWQVSSQKDWDLLLLQSRHKLEGLWNSCSVSNNKNADGSGHLKWKYRYSRLLARLARFSAIFQLSFLRVFQNKSAISSTFSFHYCTIF